jgi:hypothetical protein
MENIKKPIPDKFKGFLRFEISLEQEKIKYLIDKIKAHLPSDYTEAEYLKFFLLNTPQESKAHMQKHIAYHFKHGVYMNYNTAVCYIDFLVKKNFIKPKHRTQLLEFLELVSQKRSIYVAKQYISEKQAKKVLKLFKKIQLNPVTIPARLNARGYKYLYLPSICTCMNIENEASFIQMPTKKQVPIE